MINFDKLNLIANAYSEDEGFELVITKYKILEIKKHIHGKTMLDIGCGVGFTSKALSPYFESIFAIDGSSNKISKAIEHNGSSNIKYIHTLFESFKPNCQFDFICTFNVLEHIQNIDEFLSLIKSWMTKSARVVISVPNALGLHKRIGYHIGLINDYYQLTTADLKKGHHHVFDRNKLHKLLTKNGFNIIHSGGILLKPLSHAQMKDWDLKVVDALYEIGKDLPDYCSSLFVVAQKN